MSGWKGQILLLKIIEGISSGAHNSMGREDCVRYHLAWYHSENSKQILLKLRLESTYNLKMSLARGK